MHELVKWSELTKQRAAELVEVLSKPLDSISAYQDAAAQATTLLDQSKPLFCQFQDEALDVEALVAELAAGAHLADAKRILQNLRIAVGAELQRQGSGNG